MTINTYVSNAQRTQAYADATYLARGLPFQVITKFGEAKKLPSKTAKTISMRRYFPLAVAGILTEGVTPAGAQIKFEDINVTVQQYGNVVYESDVVDDLSEDNLAQEYAKIMSENRAETIESVYWGVARGGTSVGFANGTARNAVNTVSTVTKFSAAIRALENQRGKKISDMIAADTNIGTRPVEPAFIAFCHTDCSFDIRALPGFIPAAQYASFKPVSEFELGALNNMVRIVAAAHFDFFPDAGGAVGLMKSTSGTNADVYPIVILARQGLGQVMVGGKESGEFSIVRASKTIADPLGQRSAFGWKQYYAGVILNQAWVFRLEVAVTAI